MDQESKNLLEDYLKGLDDLDHIDGIHCKIVHPKITEFLNSLPTTQKDLETAWGDHFVNIEDQVRHCLTTEIINRTIVNSFPPAILNDGDQSIALFTLTGEDMWRTVFAVISLAWLTRKAFEKNGDV